MDATVLQLRYIQSERSGFVFLFAHWLRGRGLSQSESHGVTVRVGRACGRCLLCGGGGLVTAALVPLYSYGHAYDLADDLPVRVALSRGLFFCWAISKFYSCSQLFT